MRVVQVLGSARKGGAERFFLRLVEAFHRHGIDQTVLVRKCSWAESQLEAAGVPSRSAWFGGKFDLITRHVYRKALTEARADIVLTWMRRATTSCPAGPWTHVGRLGNYYKLKSYTHCDHLIGITPGIVDYIKREGWPANKVSLVPNFVPPAEVEPMPRAAFNTPPDQPLILWLGRMEHEKGPDIVVRALRSIPNAYLWMAGAGSFEAEVKRLAAEIGVSERVRFLGWRDDIHVLLAAADLYVCASRFEAHGNIILEAWAHGLPLVAARSPGPVDLIEDRKTGLLVANDDPEAMAAALNELIAQPALARAIAAEGRSHFEARYSEEAIVTMYMKLFERLISEKGLGATQARASAT